MTFAQFGKLHGEKYSNTKQIFGTSKLIQKSTTVVESRLSKKGGVIRFLFK